MSKRRVAGEAKLPESQVQDAVPVESPEVVLGRLAETLEIVRSKRPPGGGGELLAGRPLRAFALHLEGLRVPKIAAELKVSRQSVYNWMRSPAWANTQRHVAEAQVAALTPQAVRIARNILNRFEEQAMDPKANGFLLAQVLPILKPWLPEPVVGEADTLAPLAASDPDAPLSMSESAALAEALEVRALTLEEAAPVPTSTVLHEPGPPPENIQRHEPEVLEGDIVLPGYAATPWETRIPDDWREPDDEEEGDGWRSWR